MNWLPAGLDKLDKRVAVFLVAAGALVAMYMSTMETAIPAPLRITEDAFCLSRVTPGV